MQSRVEPGELLPVEHSYLALGGKTAIIVKDDSTAWEDAGGSRDSFVLPNGNVLLAYRNRVEEVTRAKEIVFSCKSGAANTEIGTAQRLYNGNTLVTELGAKSRLLEVNTVVGSHRANKGISMIREVCINNSLTEVVKNLEHFIL